MLKNLLSMLLRSTGQKDDSQKRAVPLTSSLQKNLNLLQERFAPAEDLIIRHFGLGGDPSTPVALVFLEHLVDQKELTEHVLQPLLMWARPVLAPERMERDLAQRVAGQLLPAQQIEFAGDLDSLLGPILNGNCAVIIDGSPRAVILEFRGWARRAVDEPSGEITLRGPRDGFTETLEDNLAMVRRRIKTPDLAVEGMSVGRKSKTEVRLLYIENLTPDNLIEEVRRRLEAVDVDRVLNSRTIQQLITDSPYSFLPTIKVTERPDTTAAALHDGRVAILVDTDPFVLIMPYEFFSIWTTAEAHNMHFALSTTLRSCAMLAFWLSIYITPFYVALTTYHQELIPLTLLMNIAVAQAGVPFPIAVTALGAEGVLEVLREAGARLPRPVGQAVSIVGALVLGQAAIQAGLVPPGLVIVAASATIFSFAVPDFEAATSFRLVRYPIIILAAVLGLYGVTWSLIIIIFHLCSLKSFGVPYLAMYTPGRVSELAEKQLAMPVSARRPIRPGGGEDRRRQGRPPERRDPGEVGDD